MKNKKGFTLVELLAVIAILGIIAIIVVPNVLEQYEDSKKMILIDEAKNIYTAASEKYVTERTHGNKISVITNDGREVNTLSLEGGDVIYTVHIDKEGNITTFKARNNKYCVSGMGNFLDDYSKEDVELLDGSSLCETSVMMDNELVTLELNIRSKDRPVINEAKPKIIYLRMNHGWYDSAKNSANKITSIEEVPNKTNYYFAGFEYSKNGSDNNYVINCAGKIITDNEDSPTKLFVEESQINSKAYAKFEKKYYNIVYNSNGGIGGMSNTKVLYGESNKKLSPIAFIKEGYLMKGWNTDPNGTGRSFTEESLLPLVTEENENDDPYFKFEKDENCTFEANNKTLYAQWQPITYTVKYNGTNANSGTMSTQEFKYDEEKALNSNKFTRTGYKFSKWKDIETNREYSDGQLVKNLTSVDGKTVNLDVVWMANGYRIAYDYANGVAGSSNPEIANYDDWITISNPTRSGYTFTGWNITGLDSNTHYYGDSTTTGSTISKTKETRFKNLRADGGTVTFTATWAESIYTIAYDYQGGKKGTNAPTSGKYNTTINISNPTRTGYVFDGWNITGLDTITHTYGSKTTTSTSISKTKETSFKNLRGDIETVTFTATWIPNTYTITYDYKSGSAGSSNPTTATYDVELTISNPTRSGYTFAGWNITGLDSTTHNYGSNTSTSTSITKSTETKYKNLRATSGTVTFTATWTAVTYSITYNYNGGVAPSSGVPASYSTGSSVTINGKPTRNGYTFNGWSAKSDLSSLSYSQKINSTDMGDKTFYAAWCVNCVKPDNGSCSLNVNTPGTCKYSVSCNTGYSKSGDGNYNATCVDITPPTCTLSVSSGKINASYSDTASPKASIAHGFTSSYEGSTSQAVPSTTTTYTYYVKDEAGNQGTCSKTVTVTLPTKVCTRPGSSSRKCDVAAASCARLVSCSCACGLTCWCAELFDYETIIGGVYYACRDYNEPGDSYTTSIYNSCASGYSTSYSCPSGYSITSDNSACYK